MRRTWLLLLAATIVTAIALPSASQAAKPAKGCVSTEGLSLAPTRTAPSWYQPGVTKFCPTPGASTDPIVEPLTAYWVYYVYNNSQIRYRTTPDNADYSANDCVASYTTCGEKIIQSASEFYEQCSASLTASQVSTNIKYWADRARANGTNWRVYTYFENGGYPYSCAFSITAI